MRGNRILVSLAFFCLPEFPLANDEVVKPAIDFPADNPAFKTLRRIQTRSGRLLPSQALPFKEALVNPFLEEADVSSADSVALAYFLQSWRKEWIQWSDSIHVHSLLISPTFDFGGRMSGGADTNASSSQVGLGGTLYGQVGPYLSFYSRGMVYTEYTDKAQFTHQFNPEFGETYSVEKGAGDSLLQNRTFNRFESYVLADLPWGITLKAGRDRVHTGPGYFSSLMASRNAPPYWLLEARLDFASWLSIDNFLLSMTDTRHDIDKFANLNRFEFRPMEGLSVAFQDIVIYQNRDPDWRYALPLTPLTFTESDMGGRDNSAMGFDFMYSRIHNLSIWGELFIDDLLGPSSFFDDFWENRWAGLTGFQITTPLAWLDMDLVVEYGHVEPWTYNGRLAQTSFKHFNVPSASRLGPDSRSVDVQLSYRPIKWLEIRERLDFTDKGLGRPGTLGTIHVDSIDGQNKEWLKGPVAERRVWAQEIGFLYGQWFSGTIGWIMDFGDLENKVLTTDLRIAW